MIVIDHEDDHSPRERELLLDRVMGKDRFGKSSEIIRRGRMPAEGMALCAVDHGRMIGTVRLWNINAGEAGDALLLGPLAVDRDYNGTGIGAALMHAALNGAQALGHRAILLVGDPEYYARFGFYAAPAHALAMPGYFERHRLLGINLGNEDVLSGASGILAPTGRRANNSRVH